MNNNKILSLSKALFALMALISANSHVSAVPYNPSCSSEYRIDETLENGARWDMCWEHRAREGIVFKEIHYTPKNGDPVDDRRLILNSAAVAQIHVPYDDNGARYHDISDYGIGANRMLDLTSGECPDGDLIQFSTKDVMCKQIKKQEFAFKRNDHSARGSTLNLFSVSPVGAYYYIPTWRFKDDGTIEPWMGATGALQRFGSNESYGWKIDDSRVGISHLHNFFWRLDFDLNSTSDNDVVEELNFPLVNGKRQLETTVFTSEAARQVNPNTMRRWRIRDNDLKNSNNHPASYDILLGDTGHQDIGPASEPFTQNDFYVTREVSTEIFASHNPSGAENLAEFVNGQSIQNRDVVVWAGVTFYHVPRSEDTPHMDAHWSHIQIKPRDWHAENPVVSGTLTNTEPTISNIGNQSTFVNNIENLVIVANDADGDDLTYSATGLPNGLVLNPISGVISGTTTAIGNYSITVSATDGIDTTSTQFNWLVKNNPPEITRPDNQSVQENSPVNLAIEATDEDANDTLVYSATNLPNGLQINTNTGVISGQPTTADTYVTVVSVSDGTDTSSEQFTWEVTALPTNNPPVIQAIGNQSGNENEAVTLAIQATDSDSNDTLNYSAIGLPAGLQINANTGVISGSPTSPGTSNVSVSVSDGTDTTSITFNWIINVVIINIPPTISNPGNQTGNMGDAASLNISAADSNGDTLSYSATGLPDGLSIDSSTGVISGSLSLANSYNVTVNVSDGPTTSTINFEWEVIVQTSDTSISNEVQSLTLDGNINDWSSLDYYSNDPDDIDDPNGQIDWLKASIAHNSDNIYIHYQNRNTVDSDNDTGSYIPWGWQTYLDTDKNASTGYQINNIGVDYIIEGNAIQKYSGTGTSWSWETLGNAEVLYNGNNVELRLARSTIGNPQELSVLFNGQNYAFNGTTVDSYPDTGSFEYTFTGIGSQNNTPIAETQSVSVGSGASVSVLLTATDADNDPLSYQVVSNPSNGTLTGSAPNLVYSANTNYEGDDSFTFKVNDGDIDSATVTVNITVTSGQSTGAVSNFVNSPIIIDGNNNDWSTDIERFPSDPDDTPSESVIDWKQNALAHDEQSLYLLYENHNNIDPVQTSGSYIAWGWQVFIDSDKNEETGFRNGALGIDYLIEGDRIHSYTGTGSNWSWQATGSAITSYDGTIAELSLDRTLIGNTSSIRIAFGGENQSYSGHGTSTDYYPDNSESFFDYDFSGSGGSTTRPVAYSQVVAVNIGTPKSITLVATSTTNALTYEIVSNPANGTLTGTAPNLTYTPDPTYTGRDSFTFNVNDGNSSSSTETVTLNITGAYNGNYSNLVSGMTVDGNNEEWSYLTAFQTDPDDITGDNNVINWEQAAMAHSADTLYLMYKNFSAINPDNNSGAHINWGWQAYLDIDDDATTGYAVNDIGADYIIEGEQIQRYTGSNNSWSWERTSASDVSYNANIAEMSFPKSLIGDPTKLEIVFMGNNYAYGGTQVDTYPENGSFTYKVTGGSVTIAYRPTANEQEEVVVATNTTTSFELNVSDIDSSELTFRLIDGPSHGTLENFDGTSTNISYVPNEDYIGTDSIRYIANDGTFDSSIHTVVFNVSSENQTTSSNGGGSVQYGILLLLGLITLFRFKNGHYLKRGATVAIVALFTSSFASAETLGKWQLEKSSEKALFNAKVMCTSKPTVGDFQDCGFVLERDKNVVKNARIKIGGGMPAHKHGLPTSPIARWSEADNRYQIEGLKFSMPGEWVLHFYIEGNDKDSVTYEFTI